MRKLAWKSSSYKRTPEFASDEFFRQTLVLPWPRISPRRFDEDGDPYFPALVLVVRPWWLCTDMRTKEARDYVRHERRMHDALYRLAEDASDDEFDVVFDAFHISQPPFPTAWS